MLPRALRYAVPALFLLLLNGFYPMDEGTEVRTYGGIGYTESRVSDGCSSHFTKRDRHLEGGAALRYRPRQKRSYMAAELSVRELHQVALAAESETTSSPMYEADHDLGLHAAVRYGYEGEHWAGEFGGSAILLPYLPIPVPLPSVKLRVDAPRDWFAFGELLTQPRPSLYPVRLGMGYAGDSVRGRVSLFMPHADLEYRVMDRLWLGASGMWHGRGELGHEWAASAMLVFDLTQPAEEGPEGPRDEAGDEGDEVRPDGNADINERRASASRSL